jgi:hypothetical protein
MADGRQMADLGNVRLFQPDEFPTPAKPLRLFVYEFAESIPAPGSSGRERACHP